jgi:hypothetical protein
VNGAVTVIGPPALVSRGASVAADSSSLVGVGAVVVDAVG